MSEMSLLPILKPRIKREKREIHREEGSEAPGASLYTRIRETPSPDFLSSKHFFLHDYAFM